MHICPRPGCDGNAFHSTCLKSRGWVERSKENLGHRMETALPEMDDSESVSVSEMAPPDKKRAGKGSSRKLSVPVTDPSQYAHIPPRLLVLARLPLVKGGEYGVVGNASFVLKARRMLKAAFKDPGPDSVPETWMEDIGEDMVLYLTDPSRRPTDAPLAYQCPKCGEPI